MYVDCRVESRCFNLVQATAIQITLSLNAEDYIQTNVMLNRRCVWNYFLLNKDNVTG